MPVRRKWSQDTVILLLLMAPCAAFFAVFSFWPLYGVFMAFQEYNPVLGFWKSPFVGLANFQHIFKLPAFVAALRNTLVINGLKLFFNTVMPVLFALMLNELRRQSFKRVTQTLSYLPYFISWVVASGLWYKLLSIDHGPLNDLLMALRVINKPIHFMAEKSLFYPILIVTDLWKNLGWNAIIYLAALSGIDPELYEAARVDGAGRLRQAWHISLPGMRPTIVLLFILNVSYLMNADFDQIYTMMNSAVLRVADVLDTYILRTLQTGGMTDYSYGIAVGLFKNTIGFALLLAVNWLSARLGQESVL